MCPAQCSYCSAASLGKEKWSFDDFKFYFDKLVDYLPENIKSSWIWHGGEPMLLGPDFYLQCYDYAKAKRPKMQMSMQSNLLLYDSAKWKDVLCKVCSGAVSTSFDPDCTGRIYNGSAENYTKLFFEKLQMVKDDGLDVSIIGTFTSEMYHKNLHMSFYEMSKSMGEQSVGIRYNYRYPAGRAKGKGDFITPEDYGKMLIEVYDRWVVEAPPFAVIPHVQLIEKILKKNELTGRCPWTNECSGRFIGLETNGNVYNCGCFADTEDEKYLYGNLKSQEFDEIVSSKPARELRRRKVKIPLECRQCSEFDICRGGCARDSILFGGGLYDKTYYCDAWKMLIARIKQSIVSGEAIRAINNFEPLKKAYQNSLR
jgi:radical SAM protein with 4Fe4S-binding SPASM domain